MAVTLTVWKVATDGAASIEGGRAPPRVNAVSTAAQTNTSATAKKIARRDADSTASAGTVSSQIVAGESMPPVLIATTETITERANAERIWATANRPVRDRK